MDKKIQKIIDKEKSEMRDLKNLKKLDKKQDKKMDKCKMMKKKGMK